MGVEDEFWFHSVPYKKFHIRFEQNKLEGSISRNFRSCTETSSRRRYQIYSEHLILFETIEKNEKSIKQCLHEFFDIYMPPNAPSLKAAKA